MENSLFVKRFNILFSRARARVTRYVRARSEVRGKKNSGLFFVGEKIDESNQSNATNDDKSDLKLRHGAVSFSSKNPTARKMAEIEKPMVKVRRLNSSGFNAGPITVAARIILERSYEYFAKLLRWVSFTQIILAANSKKVNKKMITSTATCR